MVILSKKRMMLVLSFVFISMFTYFLGTNVNNKTIQTVGLPASGKVVVLDAGHGRRRCWSIFK